MPGYTAQNLPYLLDSEPLADVGLAMKDLALAIARRTQAGTAPVTLTASPTGSVTVTFPWPYAEPPNVTATPLSATTMVVGVTAVTATQATITLRHYEAASTTATIQVGWQAVGKPANP